MKKSIPLVVARFPLAAAVVIVAGLVLSGPLARAEEKTTAGTASPVEEFSQQLEDFQKNVPALNKKI